MANWPQFGSVLLLGEGDRRCTTNKLTEHLDTSTCLYSLKDVQPVQPIKVVEFGLWLSMVKQSNVNHQIATEKTQF